MEGELREQVAPPIFIHQPLPGRFCEAQTMTKKRDLPWQNNNYHNQHQLLQLHHQQQQQLLLNSGFYQNPKNHWNPNLWNWDSVMFTAKPTTTTDTAASDALRLGTLESEPPKKKGEAHLKPPVSNKISVDDDGESLALKLGGGSFLPEEPVVRPNKRVRSGSPGGGGSYPMCQVDDCGADLSNAKDYHRRHKVCELHSKTTKALVGQQMQRFCQQCSRFHPLSEFDEGKRSCRRRLAGHNRRRRKTQPEDVSSRLLITGNPENNSGGNMDIINLITVLARLQGNNADKTSNNISIADKDRLIQILSKINSLPASANSTARLPVPGNFDLNISSHNSQVPSEHPSKVNGVSHAPATMDLFAVLSAAVAASSPDALAILSQCRSACSGDDKSKVNCLEQEAGLNVQKKPVPMFPAVGLEKGSNVQPPIEVSESPVQESRQGLPLQLFSSSPEDDSPPKLGSARKYFSSDSSNPMEERSPSSSPPVEQKLFPLHSSAEAKKHVRMSMCREDDVTTESRTSCGWNSTFELFRGSNGRAENGGAVSNLPYQSGYSSSSSDHSPSSSNSGSQDRTGRIIFKLFDKDPSEFPGTLRTQILNWLSHSPSEIESYIRPGCVVLSVYASMPLIAWEELQENLLQHVNSLVRDPGSDFWRTGRFLIHTDRQLASHKDGKIRLSKSWRTWNAPELICVSPLAVVAGKETSLVLRGRNLTVPGTKIHSAYMGGYTSKEISGSPHSGTIYDDSSIENFDLPGGEPNVFGRCFIEVENCFKGNSFPVIIADATICQELRVLESEFEDDTRLLKCVSEDQIVNFGQPRSRADVLHFLNELGWFFQRKSTPNRPASSGFSSARLKFLFTFSVERDWSALVKALLDIIVEENSGIGCSSRELLETLEEIQILNRAVKRKCRKMVNLLLHYSISSSNDNSRNYLFPPNQAGPGGLTPLHLAACTQDSEDMVDELTNDPQDIGLNCWNSVLDANGKSPYAYALMRNYQSYNQLVARKLMDKRNNQVSVTIGNPEISLDPSWVIAAEPDKPNPLPLQGRSCAQCSSVAMRRFKRMPGSQGLLHRPYVHSMLAIAAVCVCVCLFLRGSPEIGSVAPFKWENVDYGFS
ncbi:hypothetical protein AAC387_Pa02g1215 [Persea americana]